MLKSEAVIDHIQEKAVGQQVSDRAFAPNRSSRSFEMK